MTAPLFYYCSYIPLVLYNFGDGIHAVSVAVAKQTRRSIVISSPLVRHYTLSQNLQSFLSLVASSSKPRNCFQARMNLACHVGIGTHYSQWRTHSQCLRG